MNSLHLRRSSKLKWILCIILFQSFITLIFIELEPNIGVLVLGILSKYCFDPLVLWLCSSLKVWKTGQKHQEDCWLGYQRQRDNCFEWYYSYFSEGSINSLKLIILKALFWAHWIMIKCSTLNLSPNLTCIWSHMGVKEGIINCFEYIGLLHNTLA